MKVSWVPVSVIRQNMFQFLSLGLLLGVTILAVENAADFLNASNNRHQFPKQNSTDQHHQDDRNQFPTQRRGSGTHWQIQIPTLNT
ncbi:MAG: hypothetical protein AAGA83_12880 [Cyanobacteria bacterium P01_F01_bin.116]